MSDVEEILYSRAANLRRAFDQSFARENQTATRETVDLLALRIAGDGHAIRMSEIGGLLADIRITPCPSPLAEFRGIAGVRGALTPVYDLAQLLGYPPSSGRWAVLAAGDTVAFAFEAFEGHFRVEPSAIAAREATAEQHIREIARNEAGAHPVIAIPSLVAALKRRIPKSIRSKE